MNTTEKPITDIPVEELVDNFTSIGIETRTDILLSEFSSFRIGGPLAIALFPRSKNEFIKALDFSAESNVKCEVIGKGSNILFPDDGYNGIMIFTSRMKQINADGNRIVAEAGANITSVCLRAAKESLSGLEFACGIPGSCGGAVFMNAGAYGGEIADVLEYSEYYDIYSKKLCRIDRGAHSFDYRKSIYSDQKNMIITEVGFKLESGNEELIRAKMDENTLKRRNTQPHEYPNAGSIFKRPQGMFAAKMIDECGLKGLRVGDAQVSEKHAGFIVNRGRATANEVMTLIEAIKERVYEKFGVMLECEIRIIADT